jgi:hypothetical protein
MAEDDLGSPPADGPPPLEPPPSDSDPEKGW